MKRKIFVRFFAVTLISVLLMFAFGLVAVHLNTKNVVRERLIQETELAAALLSSESDYASFEKYRDNSELRITVLDLEGNVIYESDTTVLLNNHADREEVRNAIAGTPVTVERYSETFQCDMTYYAVRTALEDGREVILRLAVQSSQVSSYITALLPLLFAVLAVSLIVSFVLSQVLSGSVSVKITEIGDSLKSLNEGQYVPIRTDSSEPELYAVLNEINELNAHIHAHIRTAEGERSKLNTVLDNVTQSIIALDAQKRIIFANKSALSLFRGTPRDVGKDLMFLVEELPVYEQISAHLAEDHNFVCGYGGKILSVVICQVHDDTISDHISAILIVTDITKEKLVEKQRSDFFANASHELKTPITVLQGLSEVLMSKEGMDETSQKQLARIHKESQRLGSLISDMLMLSKIESGEAAPAAIEVLALEAVAEEILGELSEELHRRSLTAEVTGSGRIRGEQRMIYELVENLISNATKYNKEGGQVAVSVAETDAGVRLTVKDTGIGIEKEHLPRLCERFYRVDKSHSKRIGGTGLGLAIVKHICTVYSAALTIDSEPGQGTTVTVLFGKA